MEKPHEEIHRQFAYRPRCNLNREGMKDERPVFGAVGDSGRRRCPYNAARCPGMTGKPSGDVANGDVAYPGRRGAFAGECPCGPVCRQTRLPGRRSMPRCDRHARRSRAAPILISIIPCCDKGGFDTSAAGWRDGPTLTAKNSVDRNSLPPLPATARCSRRHLGSMFALMPCSRARRATDMPGAQAATASGFLKATSKLRRPHPI